MRITLPSTQIEIPEIFTDSSMLSVNNYSTGRTSGGEHGHGSYCQPGDTIIRPSQYFIEMMSQFIMDKELSYVRKYHPEINMDRIQEYLQAGDEELQQLGYSLLDKHCRYTSRIIKAKKSIGYGYSGINHALEEVIMNYVYMNRLNIGEKVL